MLVIGTSWAIDSMGRGKITHENDTYFLGACLAIMLR